MRKNLIVLADFPPFVGGTTIWYYRICELLISNGYSVYTLGGKGNPPKGATNLNYRTKKNPFIRCFLLVWDATTEAIKESRTLVPLIQKGLLKAGDMGHIISFLLMIKRTMRLIPQDSGIVLVSHVNINSLLAYMLCKRHGKLKFVIREHGSGVLKFCSKRPELVRFLLSQSNYVNCVSKFIADECVRRGADARRIRVILSARDIPEIETLPEKENVVLFCGFLEPHKDPFTYLRAVKEIHGGYKDVNKIKFVMIGKGTLGTQMQEFCRNNNLEESVNFTGELPIAHVWEWMKKSKVLVLPSVREASGAVLTEAMARRCYCIASNIGGIPELVTPERGSLFEQGDHKQLANLIVEYFDKEGQFQAKLDAGYHYVKENYSFEKASMRLMDIFEEIR